MAIVAIALVAAACGNGDEPTSSSTSVPASEPNPISGSIDGTFVVGEGSEATFTVNEKLSRLPLPNDAVLRTSDITGEIDLSAATASIEINLLALESDDSRRDRYVRDRLFSSQSTASISISSFPDIPEEFAQGQSFTSTVIGTVNVNGTDADIEFTIEPRLDPDRLLVLIKGDFTWADFGMAAPTSNFFVVKDDVHVEVLISAPPK
ncbi:YceI family protein [Dehalococcoides mccartyi]|nr:YceI family protein [Dehalococcoides mccartyi]